MYPEKEKIVDFYLVSYLDPVTKKRVKSRWKMTEDDAAKHFAGMEYHILYGTKEQRRIGGDPMRNSTSSFGWRYAGGVDGPEVPRYYIWHLDDVKGWQKSESQMTIRAAAIKYAGVEWDPIWPSEIFFR